MTGSDHKRDATHAAEGPEEGQLPASAETPVNSASAGATLLMVSSILTKLLTFLLNQSLVRFVTPQMYGVSSYLEFLYMMILFFSREAVRLSIQRTVPRKHPVETYQSIVNFGYIAVVLGVVSAAAMLAWQSTTDTFKEVSAVAHFSPVLVMYIASVALELAVEPIYCVNQYMLNFARRSKFEGSAVLARCIVTVTTVALAQKVDADYTLVGFGLGQLAYSFVLFVSYSWSFVSDDLGVSLYPRKCQDGFLDEQVWKFWRISVVQMVFKQFLTEGDKFIMSSYFNVVDRGVYTVVTNYGSIIVRMLFQPLEESIRLSFTRQLAQYKQNGADHYLKSAVQTIKLVLIVYLQLSVLIALTGYTNAAYLLKMLLGGKSSNWTHTDLFQIFPIYILYIPFLAFNGVLEAFFSAAASNRQTTRYSLYMTGVSVLVLGLSYVFINTLDLGLASLVYSNIINMTLRIGYCGIFLYRYLVDQQVAVDVPTVIKLTLSVIRTAATALFVVYKFIGTIQSQSLVQVVKSTMVCGLCGLWFIYIAREQLEGPIRSILRKFIK